MAKKKYEIDGIYKISHNNHTGMYALICVSGGKYHLFNNNTGHDLMLSKAELTAAEEKYKSENRVNESTNNISIS